MNAEQKGENQTIPTNDHLQKLLHDYSIGDLKKYQQQSEANPNSLIFIPNRIRSDGENDCRGGRKEPVWKSDQEVWIPRRTYLPSRPPPQTRSLRNTQDQVQNMRQGEIRKRLPQSETWNCEHLQQAA